MAMATNTTPGSIILKGDLVGAANAPELCISGVAPGTYGPVNLVADAKGRLIYARTSSQEDVESTIPFATTSSLGKIQPCGGLLITDGVLSTNVPLATYTTKGEVILSPNFNALAGELSANYATDVFSGTVRIGTNIVIDGNGFTTNGTNSVPATTSSLGVVSAGAGIDVVAGEISIPVATTGTRGVIRVGSGVAVDVAGNLTLDTPNATNSTLGLAYSADTANITITTGAIAPGLNVALLDNRNTFSQVVRRQYEFEDLTSAGSMDLTSTEILRQQTAWSTFSTPTGPSGSTFEIFGTAIASDFAYRAFATPAMYSVAYNGTIYVGVSRTSSFVSTDGVTWTSYALPAPLNYSGSYDFISNTSAVFIAWNGTTFCIRQNGFGSIFTSTDGITWTTTSVTGSYAVVTSLTVKGTSFYASTGTFMMISSNGTTWTGVGVNYIDPIMGESGWNSVIWNGTKFCAVLTHIAGSNRSSTSTDGITWTPSANLPSTQIWVGLAWNGTTFLVTNTTNSTVAKSTTGSAWTSHTANFQKQPESSVFGLGGLFVTSTWNGYISKSTDGVSWTNILSPANGYSQASYARFIAGSSGSIRMFAPSVTQQLVSAVQPFNFSSQFKFNNACPISDFRITGVWVDGIAFCSYI